MTTMNNQNLFNVVSLFMLKVTLKMRMYDRIGIHLIILHGEDRSCGEIAEKCLFFTLVCLHGGERPDKILDDTSKPIRALLGFLEESSYSLQSKGWIVSFPPPSTPDSLWFFSCFSGKVPTVLQAGG